MFVKYPDTCLSRWPHSAPGFPRRIIFTRNIDKKVEDILIEVLSALLPPEMATTDELPLNDYVLRVYGHDEFLDRECTLGSFPFVGNSIALGQDVELEVGKRTFSVNQTSVPFTRPGCAASMLLNAQNFEVYVSAMTSYINGIAKQQDYKIWSQVLEFKKLLRSSMNQTLLKEIDVAVEAINSAVPRKEYEIAVSNFASAITRQLFAYSRSSFTNFSVQTVSIFIWIVQRFYLGYTSITRT